MKTRFVTLGALFISAFAVSVPFISTRPMVCTLEGQAQTDMATIATAMSLLRISCDDG